MNRPAWMLAFGLVASIALAAPSRTEGSAYYSASYVGTARDLVGIQDGRVTNHTTGFSYDFSQSTQGRVQAVPSGYFLGLPTNQVTQGAIHPILKTYTMRPVAVDHSGIVLGQIPIHGSSDPWRDAAVGFTVKQADGSFSPFVQIAHYGYYYAMPQLSESGQIVINRIGSVGDGGGSMLYDVKTGVETAVRDLFRLDLLASYKGSLYTLGISDRGDLLVDLGGDPWTPAGLYLLTPPGLDSPSPVPEPSALWIAAAAIAGLAVRARRRAG